jgi:hypothetical protein
VCVLCCSHPPPPCAALLPICWSPPPAGMSYKVHAGATQGPAPEHFEIRSQEQLQAACYDKPGLCLITLLDGRADTANQHRYAPHAAHTQSGRHSVSQALRFCKRLQRHTGLHGSSSPSSTGCLAFCLQQCCRVCPCMMATHTSHMCTPPCFPPLIHPRDTVKQAAAAHAGQPVNWVVVDVAAQPSFRRAYGFSADQLPALLALSTKRMRFAQVGAWCASTVAQSMLRVMIREHSQHKGGKLTHKGQRACRQSRQSAACFGCARCPGFDGRGPSLC